MLSEVFIEDIVIVVQPFLALQAHCKECKTPIMMMGTLSGIDTKKDTKKITASDTAALRLATF